MKYVCLCYEEEKLVKSMPKADWNQVVKETYAGIEEMRKKGQLVASQALEFTDASTTVRVRNGRVTVTDGPFAETKEQLGGFFLIEARDLNDAIQIASRLSGAKLGCIEVRPVKELK